MPVRGYFFSETFSIFFTLNLDCPFESSKISCAVLNWQVDQFVKISTLGNLEPIKNLKNDEYSKRKKSS